MPLPYVPVPALQNELEFGLLWNFVSGQEPTTVLEIGSFCGGTLWAWMQIPSVQRVVSVDLVVPDDHPKYDLVRESRSQWQQWAMDSETDLVDLVGDSKDLSSRAAEFAPFDFMFIDGDHSYQGISSDYRLYSPMLSQTGFVAIHDTVEHAPGVRRFAAEMKERAPTVEVYNPQNGAGIMLVLPHCKFPMELS